jgi:hypothetical protein
MKSATVVLRVVMKHETGKEITNIAGQKTRFRVTSLVKRVVTHGTSKICKVGR